MGSVNVDNFEDGIACIHLAKGKKKSKLGVLLIEVKINTLVPLHLQPQTCNFAEI